MSNLLDATEAYNTFTEVCKINSVDCSVMRFALKMLKTWNGDLAMRQLSDYFRFKLPPKVWAKYLIVTVNNEIYTKNLKSCTYVTVCVYTGTYQDISVGNNALHQK